MKSRCRCRPAKKPGAMAALLQPTCLVHHPTFNRPQTGNDFPADRGPQFTLRPGTVANKLLQTLRINAQSFGHRGNGLALARQQESLHISGGGNSPLTATQNHNQWNQKLWKVLLTLFPEPRVPLHGNALWTKNEIRTFYLT